MRNVILIIIVCFCEACTSNRSMHSDLIDIDSCDYFNDESFDSIISLTSVVFNDSIICNPTKVALYDSILFSLDAAYSSDTLINCYSILDKHYLGAVFLRGNGPKELLSATSVELSADSSCFWTFDITKQIWVGRQCKELNDGVFLPDENCKILNLRDTILLAKNNPIWLEKGFIVNSLFKYKERFFIYDSINGSKRAILNYCLHFKDAFNEQIMADIFSTQRCITPDRSKIILAGRYLDLIEIYDSNGNIEKMLKGPHRDFNFKFDVERSMKNSALVKSKDSRRAYLSVKATPTKIYALYSGKAKQDEEHYSYSRMLYVFSLKGDLLFKYILDKPIIDFVVDEKRNCIYATSIDAELIYFNI